MRCVTVKKDVYAQNTLLVIMLYQVGKIGSNILGLRLRLCLKKELCRCKIYGKQTVGAGLFFSSVVTVGRVFFFAQP
jgi:hypothetical protein